MTTIQYKRAPITEAVVEFRSYSSIDKRKQEKAFKQFKKIYFNNNDIKKRKFQFEVKPEGDPVANTTEEIRKQFSSEDMTEQLTLGGSTFLVSQLAPYQGWDKFNTRIRSDWKIWRDHVGFQDVKRIGMRYINRIDMPITEPVTEYEKFVNVFPSVPDILDPCSYYSVSMNVKLDDINGMLNLNTGRVQSPVPEHMAILVDIDVYRDFESPQSDDELYDFLIDAHNKKNEIFEACITDKSREIFNS